MLWDVFRAACCSCMRYSTIIVQCSGSKVLSKQQEEFHTVERRAHVTQSAAEVWTRATSVITFLNASVTLQWADVPCAGRNWDYFNASEPRARSCILWRKSSTKNHLLMPMPFQTRMTFYRLLNTKGDFFFFFCGENCHGFP